MRPENDASRSVLQARARSKLAILVFVVLAFAWAWGVGFAATQVEADSPALNAALMMLAGFAPSLAGMAVVAIFSRPADLRDWAKGCLNWRVGWRWFILAFLAPPVLLLIPARSPSARRRCALPPENRLAAELPGKSMCDDVQRFASEKTNVAIGGW